MRQYFIIYHKNY